MGLLEDRILRIIELRKKGLEDLAIAEDLGIDIGLVREYEKETESVMRESLSFGVRGVNIASEKTGLSPVAVKIFANYYGISLYEREGQKPRGKKIIVKRKTKEKMKSLKEAILNNEVGNNGDASRFLDVSFPYVTVLMKEIGAKFMPKSWHTINRIQQAISQGARTRGEIADIMGLGYVHVSRLVKQGGIEVERKGLNRRWYPVADRLIKRGLTLKVIGQRVGFSREKVRRYIKSSGQHKEWKKSRFWYKNTEIISETAKQLGLSRKEVIEYVKERDNDIGCLKTLLQRRRFALENILLLAREAGLRELSEDDEWAARKAFQYRGQIKAGQDYSYPLETLFSIFRRYREAQKSGEKLSLEELGKDSSLIAPNVGRVLKGAGLKPLYGTRDRHVTPKEKKNAIKRAVSLEMPLKDIAYFLEIPEHVVSQNIRLWRLSNQRPKIKKAIKRFGNRLNLQSLSYRLASQIYKSQELGFSRKETAELLDTSERVVNYALEHQGDIKPRIMAALDVAHLDE